MPELGRLHQDVVNREEDWRGWTEASQRRKMQNRLNQRASRRRKRESDWSRLVCCSPSPSLAQRLRPLLPKLSSYQNASSDAGSGECNSLSFSIDISRQFVTASEFGTRLYELEACAPVRELDHMRVLCPLLETPLARQIYLESYELSLQRAMQHGQETVQQAMWHVALRDDLVLLAILWGGSCTRLMMSSNDRELNQVREVFLDAQLRCTPIIRDRITRCEITDGLILAINHLAVIPDRSNAQANQKLKLRLKEAGKGFTSPVAAVGRLDYVGTLRWAPQHIAMSAKLVAEVGGIENIQSAAIREVLQFIFLLAASREMTRPMVGIGPSYSAAIQELQQMPARSYNPTDFPTSNELREVCLILKKSVYVQESFLDGSAHITVHDLIKFRDVTHYLSLSLPPQKGVHEIWRLLILIFNYGVTFPHPEPQMLRKLAELLYAHLVTLHPNSETDHTFLLWATMMGAMAAAESAFEPLYIQKMQLYAYELEICEWDAAKLLLRRFLWMDLACNYSAKELWEKTIL